MTQDRRDEIRMTCEQFGFGSLEQCIILELLRELETEEARCAKLKSALDRIESAIDEVG